MRHSAGFLRSGHTEDLKNGTCRLCCLRQIQH